MLPPQVVGPANCSSRPPVSDLPALPVRVVLPSKRCVPAPVSSPPRQVAGPATVKAPVPDTAPAISVKPASVRLDARLASPVLTVALSPVPGVPSPGCQLAAVSQAPVPPRQT